MKVYHFSEFPYHEYPDGQGDKYPSLRLTFPNSYLDPNLANGLFRRYFDECQYVDELCCDALLARHSGDGAPDHVRPAVQDIPRGHHGQHRPVRQGCPAGDQRLVGDYRGVVVNGPWFDRLTMSGYL